MPENADPYASIGRALLDTINAHRAVKAGRAGRLLGATSEAEQDEPESESEAELRRGRELAAEHAKRTPQRTGYQTGGASS